MGQACHLPGDYKVCLTQRLMLLRSDPEFINSEFLLHYINSPYFREQVLNVCRGLTTPHIRVKDAPNFLIPLPPIEQQNYIVHYLGGLKAQKDKLVASQSQTTAELNALLPSILDKAFKGEL
jgi:type I restriction enzyme S subunit